MSVHIQSMVWFREFNTPAQKLVALCLADFCDDNGKCWPSNALIARKCGLSEQTVENAIAVFKGCGLIVRETRMRGDGSRSSSLTTFDVAKLEMESRAGRKLAVKEAEDDRRESQEYGGEPVVCRQNMPRTPGGKKQGVQGVNGTPHLPYSAGGHEPSVNHQNNNTPPSPRWGKRRMENAAEQFIAKYPKTFDAIKAATCVPFEEPTRSARRDIGNAIEEIAESTNVSDDDLAASVAVRVQKLKKKWENIDNITARYIARHWASVA